MYATDKDYRWYDLALKIATESNCADKHGCVIVRGGSVIALAANRPEVSHPVSEKWLKKSIHAEQRALLKVAGDAKGATLYSARLHERNAHSAPCEMCETLIAVSGVKRVVFHNGETLIKMNVESTWNSQMR